MISTSTYRDRTTADRDLLAAFSPLDHATTAALSAEAVQGAYERLLRRLVTLIALHGPSAPTRYLAALDDAVRAGDGTAAGPDVVDLTAAFLEHGNAHGHNGGNGAAAGGAADGGVSGVSELQQEIVHFSRIVDIGHLGLDVGAAEHALRRVRGSTRLPDSLKVLSELVIVARSRLIQRGARLPVPCLRPGRATETDVAEDLTTCAPTSRPDYWMVVGCARRRTRRQIRYELSALLEYLTPAEAALTLWAHCHEQRLGTDVEFGLVQVDTIGGVTVVTWSYRAAGPAEHQVGRWVAATLPAVVNLTARTSTSACGHLVEATGPASARITGRPADAETVLRARTVTGPPTPDLLAGRARDLIASYNGPDLVSVEAGHIHLDRDLDADQDAGTAIGAAVHALLAQRQARLPALTPMMDDDHVLIRLTPATYEQFLRRTFGAAAMHLICESSPIIRAIAVALFQRLRHSRHANRLQKRGSNLFLTTDDGTPCELFEDIDGTPITGCVFFEVALLIYRSAPERFDDYFADRYHLDTGVHEHAAAILSTAFPAQGAARHDATVTALQDYYRRFTDVTDPHRPDPHITGLVTDVLTAADPVFAHLNVLEDYYEVQQRRVRALTALLDLPLRLITLHFNTATGRVVLRGSTGEA